MSNFRYTRPDSFPPIVRNLILINGIVFILQKVLDAQFLQNGDEMGLTGRLALWPVDSPFFQPYQIATHMFTHGGFQHILFNMLSLYVFGRLLENVWGHKRFLFFYLVSGLGAAGVHLLVNYLTHGGNIPVVGASGAIMGLVAAFGYVFPNTEMYMFFVPFPIKAKWLAIGYVVLDLFGGINGGDNIAHFAHLGGALTGFILVLIWNKTNRKRFY